MSDYYTQVFEDSMHEPETAAHSQVEAIAIPSWRRKCDLSCAAILAGETLLVVTGAPGTGKTLLLQSVARVLRSAGWWVVECVASLPSQVEFDALTTSTALLIDDADWLSAAELEAVYNLQGCSVLLAGTDALAERCHSDRRVALTSIAPEEVAIFASLWLMQAGQDPDRLRAEASMKLAELSAGIPGVAASLLAAAVEMADLEGAKFVSTRHLDDAGWRHVENLAADRAGPAVVDAAAESEQDSAETEWEEASSQVPYADLPDSGQRPLARPSRAMGLGAFGVALVVTTGAGLALAHFWAGPSSSPRAFPISAVSAPAIPPPAAAKPPVMDAARAEPAPAALATPPLAAVPVPAFVPSVATEMDTTEPGPADAPARPASPEPTRPGAAATESNAEPAPDAPTLTAAASPLISHAEPAATGISKPPIAQAQEKPGLMLVVRHGDTKRSLYNQMYAGLAAPTYAEFKAANRRRLRAGGFVVFPAPLDGWGDDASLARLPLVQERMSAVMTPMGQRLTTESR